MTDDQMKDSWQSQHLPFRSHEALGQIITSKNSAMKRQVVASFAIAICAFSFGLFNFWGQHFWNGDTLLVSLLRALPVLLATAIHIMVCRRLAKEQQERLQLTTSHGAWLRRWVDGLDAEVRGRGIWKIAAFFAFLFLITSITKWLDYKSGEDSLGECIGVVIAVAALFPIAALFLWHYQKHFLIPELQRGRKMLSDLEGNHGA